MLFAAVHESVHGPTADITRVQPELALVLREQATQVGIANSSRLVDY